MKFTYNLFLKIYLSGIYIATFFNEKAKLWLDGRKNIFERLETAVKGNPKIIWMHCASLGEFEQGRPVLENLKEKFPEHKLLLTFFSPSGYEIRKNYQGADWVFYLPLDTATNAYRFIKTVNPQLAIFVKYEYWHNYLKSLHDNNIPSILISALFTPSKVFFKWYGGFPRKMLKFFSHIFVQNDSSKENLSRILSAEKITVAGDTRFDRVSQIINSFKPIEPIEKFVNGKKVMVAGSTWPDDENNLKSLLDGLNEDIKLIIAPHEIHTAHIDFLRNLFPAHILYSELEILSKSGTEPEADKNVVIINNIGMLSRLYHYGTISYIGGGFNKSGIHNTLEAAVYGHPVIFGPNYQKFSEAIGLVERSGGYSYDTDIALKKIVLELWNDDEKLISSGNAAGKFVKENIGATHKIMTWIKENVF